MRTLLTILTVLVFTSLNPAQAGSKEENIRKLLEIARSEELVRQHFTQTWPDIWALTRKAHPDIPSNLAEMLEGEFVIAVDEMLSVFLEGSVDIYSKYFTPGEIEELLAWYVTDLAAIIHDGDRI